MPHLDQALQDTLARLQSGKTNAEQATEQVMSLLRQDDGGISDAARLLMAGQYEAIADTLAGLVAGVREYDQVGSAPAEQLDEMLRTANNRFAIQLSAALFDTPFVHGSQAADTTSTSIRVLRGQLGELADAIAQLVASSIAGARVRQELELAGTVQKMLVPSEPERDDLHIASWFRPAEACSGDWWTVADLTKTDALFALGDVTGHGAAAALVTATMKGAVDMARLGMQGSLKPFMLMTMLNHVLLDNVDGDYLMTSVIGRYDRAGGKLALANAGHRAPWLIQGGSLTPITGDRSPPLGTRRAQRYTETTIEFAPSDLLVLFTDGIPEAESPDGREFGERAFRAVVEAAAPRGPAAIVKAVQQAVLNHIGDEGRLDDDVTLLVLAAR